MGNEEYQSLLRTPHEELRHRIAGTGRGSRAVTALLADLDDEAIAVTLRDLGGHDLVDLVAAMRAADAEPDRPSVIFAYTIKAWSLPTQGHPANHSALLSTDQWEQLAGQLGADHTRPWERFETGTAEHALCEAAATRLQRPETPRMTAPELPQELGRTHAGSGSTQQALGRFFVDLAHARPDVAERVVTVSPDVASSTNLGGWINRAGVWNPGDRNDWFAEDRETVMHWKESTTGQHIELGIAETNLVGLLGELGATWSRDGHPLLPIGTMYDPFVQRALEPWSFGMYAGGQSILIGTPSGVTLAPEGGAHQSISTPSVGIEQPGCTAYEPAFGQDFEWTLLHALAQVGHPDGSSAYFRLSTRPVDQTLAQVPTDPQQREQRRRGAIAGGYRVRTAASPPVVTLAGVGAIMPEVLGAADELATAGIAVDVLCITSPDLLFRAVQGRQGLASDDHWVLGELLPAARSSPLVTVLDGHPHTLAFLAGVNETPIATLGVQGFGQSGDVDDLYRYFGIDTDTIVGAALDLIA
jgi:pyruvate dehydrogenase E1 component